MAGNALLAVGLYRCRDQLHDPGAAGPDFLDVIGGILGPELPDGLTPMAFLGIRCIKSDVPFPLELEADLALDGLLVGLSAGPNDFLPSNTPWSLPENLDGILRHHQVGTPDK